MMAVTTSVLFLALHLTWSAESLKVLLFMPEMNDEVLESLNMFAVNLISRNHEVTTFQMVVVPEQRQPTCSNSVLKQLGNRAPWYSDFKEEFDTDLFYEVHLNVCTRLLHSDTLDRLASVHFDVALVYAGNPCILMLAHALSLPFIYYDKNGFSDEIAYASGSPLLVDLVPSGRSRFAPSMSVTEAMNKFWYHVREYSCVSDRWLARTILCPRWTSFERRIMKLFASNHQLKTRFTNFGDVSEIKQRAAVYFVNSDPLVEFAGRVTSGRIVYVGGINQVAPQPLPEVRCSCFFRMSRCVSRNPPIPFLSSLIAFTIASFNLYHINFYQNLYL
ncbi:unnamed protein product [Soboliphyme baturini]|uniref:glucuronosyltransferase n=1 Tax=Soboliphyme baturini TaxID=241478 RepID=A0A183IXZ0_9BILA|nr:unnamed protein product [Soboliphyme baturini]